MKSLQPLAIIFVLTIIASIISLYVYGLVLAFTAHVLTGIVWLLLPPLSLVTGIAQFFFAYNIPAHVVALFPHA